MDHMGRVGEAGGRRLPWKQTQEEHKQDERGDRDETRLQYTYTLTVRFRLFGASCRTSSRHDIRDDVEVE